jgi:hypothetical protein
MGKGLKKMELPLPVWHCKQCGKAYTSQCIQDILKCKESYENPPVDDASQEGV